MEYGNRFKRSLFGGFKRADVLKCFEELSEEKTNEINDLLTEKQKLSDQLGAAKASLEQAEEVRKAIEQEKDSLAREAEELKQIVEDQNTRLERATGETEKAASESRASLQLLKERDVKIAFLEDKTQKLTLKLEASESKSRKYDKLSVEIGEMMLEAKQSAEQIIRQAQLRSEQMAAEADTAVDTLSLDLETFLQQLGQIKNSLHSLMGSVDNQLQSIENSLSSAQENIRSYKSSKKALSADGKPEKAAALEEAISPKPHFFR